MSKTYLIEWGVTGVIKIEACCPEEAINIFDRTVGAHVQQELARNPTIERHSEPLTPEDKAREDKAFNHWLKRVFPEDQQEHSRCLAENSR